MKCVFSRFRLGVLALSTVGIAYSQPTLAANVGGVTSASQYASGATTSYYVARPYGSVANAINPGSTVSLNPQPLPPKVFSQSGNFGSTVSLNPQPLPPKVYYQSGNFGSTVSLNPQPLPPKVYYQSGNFGSTVSLNPQPLPPKVYFQSGNFGSEVSLNPQPLPPKYNVLQRQNRRQR
jgi:hypothetical protein